MTRNSLDVIMTWICATTRCLGPLCYLTVTGDMSIPS